MLCSMVIRYESATAERTTLRTRMGVHKGSLNSLQDNPDLIFGHCMQESGENGSIAI
jgi:hypothetical protein